MSLRIAIGSVKQETNTFSGVKTTLQSFREGIYWAESDRLLDTFAGTRTELGGFIDLLRQGGAEIVPTFAAHSMSSGPLTRETHEWLLQQILDGIGGAGRVDAVLLAMHGAMVSDGYEDGTGHILAQVRALVGPQVPIAASLDLHAHLTPQMVEASDILVGFETYPHIDLYETGSKTATLLLRQLKGEIKPVIALAKAPMLLQAEGQGSAHGPFRRLLDAARSAEKEPGILSVSLFPVQPWLDIPHTGFGVIVVSDDRSELAQQEAQRLADLAWGARHEFDVVLVPPEQAVQRALSLQGKPIVLSDSADGVGSGSAGNGTNVLKALLAANLREPAMITLIDPEAVQQAISAGFNREVTLTVGGKSDPVFNQPLQVTGRVKTISDAAYKAYGVTAPMGHCVVLEIGRIDLLLMSYKAHTVSPSLFRAVGLEPTDAKIVVVKSPTQFRDEFEPLAREIIMVDAPGISSANFKSLPFQHITRPLYPFDFD